MIAAWWQGLQPNERRMLALGAPLVALMLGWAFVWHPLAQRRVTLGEDEAARRLALAYVERGAAEVERLRAAGMRSRGDRAGRSLLALVDATAREAGLGDGLQRVEPMGARSVRLNLSGVRFDALASWLEELAQGYGVEAESLSAERAEGIGRVNASLTLLDAP